MERIILNGKTPAANFAGYLAANMRDKPTTPWVDVVLTIDGTPVSFTAAINAFAASLDGQALVKAEEIISEAGLAPIVTALRSARIGIVGALKGAADKINQRKEVIDDLVERV